MAPKAGSEEPPNAVGRMPEWAGALGSMTRALTWKHVADLGGMPLDGVTKKTNLLVFGQQDLAHLAPGATSSNKFTKDTQLKAKGADIEIIGEEDFLAMLVDAGITPGVTP